MSRSSVENKSRHSLKKSPWKTSTIQTRTYLRNCRWTVLTYSKTTTYKTKRKKLITPKINLPCLTSVQAIKIRLMWSHLRWGMKGPTSGSLLSSNSSWSKETKLKMGLQFYLHLKRKWRLMKFNLPKEEKSLIQYPQRRYSLVMWAMLKRLIWKSKTIRKSMSTILRKMRKSKNNLPKRSLKRSLPRLSCFILITKKKM